MESDRQLISEQFDILCNILKTTPAEIRFKDNRQDIADKRKIISSCLLSLGHSYSDIGHVMNRHHSTIVFHVKNNDYLKKEIVSTFEVYRDLINGKPDKAAKGRIFLNLSYVMADVANTFCVKAEGMLASAGFALQQQEKYKFNRMMQALRNLKQCTKAVTSELYKIRNVDAACEDSDWLADMVLLLISRSGESEERMKMIHDMVYEIPSKIHVYE